MTDHDMLMIWEVYKRIDEWTGAMIVFVLFIFCTSFFTTYFPNYSDQFPWYTLDCSILIFFQGEIVHTAQHTGGSNIASSIGP